MATKPPESPGLPGAKHADDISTVQKQLVAMSALPRIVLEKHLLSPSRPDFSQIPIPKKPGYLKAAMELYRRIEKLLRSLPYPRSTLNAMEECLWIGALYSDLQRSIRPSDCKGMAMGTAKQWAWLEAGKRQFKSRKDRARIAAEIVKERTGKKAPSTRDMQRTAAKVEGLRKATTNDRLSRVRK
jgi:hypothetical protein